MARILIAEDQKDIRDLVTLTLEYVGHEVLASPNGEDALKKAIAHHPDLVLLDMHMPKMDGLEVCHALKANPDLQHIPVIFFTGDSGTPEYDAIYEAGASGLIEKPFAPDDLISKVASYLSNQ